MWRLKPNDWKLFGPLPIEMGGGGLYLLFRGMLELAHTSL